MSLFRDEIAKGLNSTNAINLSLGSLKGLKTMEKLIQNLAKVTTALFLGGAIGVGSYVALVPEKEAKPVKNLVCLIPKAAIDAQARDALVDAFGILTAPIRSPDAFQPLYENSSNNSNPTSPQLEELLKSMAGYCYAARRFKQDPKKYSDVVKEEENLGRMFQKYDLDLNPNLIWEDVKKINSVLIPNGYLFIRDKFGPGFDTEFLLYKIVEHGTKEVTLFNPKKSREEQVKVQYVLLDKSPLMPSGNRMAFNLNGVRFVEVHDKKDHLKYYFNTCHKNPNNWNNKLLLKEWDSEYKKAIQSANPEETFADLAL